jgi:predicted DNA-binding transcriptional regulator AlpA
MRLLTSEPIHSPGELPAAGLVRLHQILAPVGPIPLSENTWMSGVRAGRFPQPVHLSPRAIAWKVEEIRDLVERGPPGEATGSAGNIEMAWRNWVASQPATHAITLASNNVLRLRPGQLPQVRKISPDRFRADVELWHRNVDRRRLGPRFTAHPDQRIRFIGFIEHADENIHGHLLADVPEHRPNRHGTIKEIIDLEWAKVTRGYGSVDVQPIRDLGWASYCMKAQFGAALENPSLFLFSRALGITPTP